ncbi:MAG: GNAT family N-acetyltransferase [Planctomycetes bacterium]|nr:GNAT family N-acetyltransferase [Planctomycetota bacterium]
MLARPTQAVCPPPLSLRLVTDRAGLDDLAAAWEELRASSNTPEPMLSANWLRTWWRIYGEGTGRRLCVGLFLDGDRLLGLAPLQARRVWHHRVLPLRRLEFLGADVDENDGVCSEYLNLLARTGHEEQVARAFATAVAQGRFGPWDELVLSRMDGSGAAPVQLAESFARHGLTSVVTTTSGAPFLRLPPTWDDYIANLPSRKRRFLLKSLSQFDDWAGDDARFLEVHDATDLETGRRILADLHQQRWHGTDQPGAFSSPRFEAFHQQHMRDLLDDGKLELFWLEVRGQPIAAHYNFIANDKTYYYQSGRRMDLPTGVNPGTIIMVRALKNAMARGAREFDFLADPSQFKAQFTTTIRPLVQLRVTHGSFLSRAAARRHRANARPLARARQFVRRLAHSPRLTP